MAIGDLASEAGLPLVAGTAQASDIDLEINRTRDMIARLVLDIPDRMTPGPTAPTNPKIGDVWFRTGSA